jgi:hypothetical protein
VRHLCDKHQTYSPLAGPAFDKLKETNPEAARYMQSFTPMDEKHCMPVQAGDAVAYEIRRALNYLHKYEESGALREQFKTLADAHGMAYMAHTSKEQLEWIAANHHPGEPFKMDEIMGKIIEENIDKIRVVDHQKDVNGS